MELITLTNGAAKLSTIGDEVAHDALERENVALRARVAELERLVAYDTLTPVFNRRHFMDELDRWCWRNHRYGGEYGLLFVDVDNLKAVNDRYGHLAGDLVLITIAKALLASTRRSDIVARVGGDEFAIFLVDIPTGQIGGKAERIAKAVSRLEIPFQSDRLITNISIGFTPVEAGDKPIELLLRADRAMYAAKQGKDQDAQS